MPKSRMKSSTKQKYELIAAIRAQKSLYDPKSANFKSNTGVWNQVAAQCGIKRGQIAKLVWKNIRDAYIAHRKHPDKNPNQNYCMFFKHMDFIDPYLIKHTEQNKSPVSGCKVNTEIVHVEKKDDKDEEVKSLNMNETTTNREFTTIQYWNETKDDSENATELETNSTHQPTNEPRSEFNSDSDMESYEDIILPNALNNGSIDNSLKMFFDAMFASTSQLSQVLQRTVKRKIFSAVIEAEEEAEKQKACAIGANCIQIDEDF